MCWYKSSLVLLSYSVCLFLLTNGLSNVTCTVHNIFSNFLCFISYFANHGAISNNFNSNGQNRILGK